MDKFRSIAPKEKEVHLLLNYLEKTTTMNKALNILLVEDDPNLGLLLKEYLIAKGHKTTLCINGQEGYDTFHKKTVMIF